MKKRIVFHVMTIIIMALCLSLTGALCEDKEGDLDKLLGLGLVSCPAGLESCTGSCVDLLADDDNCGSCGNACESGYYCDNGECEDIDECAQDPYPCPDMSWICSNEEGYFTCTATSP